MTEAEMIEAKQVRRAARSVFETQKELVRSDLGAASLGKRVANRLVEDTKFMAEEAKEAVDRNKGLAAAGAAVLTGLLLHKPLMAFAASAFGMKAADEYEEEPAQPDVEAPSPPA